MALLHHRCVGCENRGRPGRSGQPNRQHRCSGNRRRGTRRRGAAAAFERQALRSAPREAVPGEVQAGSAGAPARVPRAMRAAAPDRRPGHVRRNRRSRRCTHAQHGAAARNAAAERRGDGAEGGSAQRDAGGVRSGASGSERTGDRRSPRIEVRGKLRDERGAKRARGCGVAAPPMCERGNGPRRRRSDDAARDALRTKRCSGGPGFRAAGPCPRGCR